MESKSACAMDRAAGRQSRCHWRHAASFRVLPAHLQVARVAAENQGRTEPVQQPAALTQADRHAQDQQQPDDEQPQQQEHSIRRLRRSTHHRQPADTTLDQLASSSLHGRAAVWASSGPATAVTHTDTQGDSFDAVGKLAKANSFEQALAMLQRFVTARDEGTLARVSQRYYMRYVGQHKAAPYALKFLKTLPAHLHNINTYQLALGACAASQDAATGAAVLELALANGFTPDTKLMTALMNVYKSVGSVDKAFSVYMDIKRRGLTVDAHVIGVLVAAFAQAMAVEADAQQDRKDKLVLMERAAVIVQEAEENGLKLTVPCWNSLIVCAGRCGQLKRAFEMLDSLQLQGLRADAYTYGALMEACIQAQRLDLVHRLFEQALSEKHTGHVELYTSATTACHGPQHVDWQQALRIANIMQRHQVTPDQRYYSALMAVAGRAGKVEHAFELLEDMTAEGLRPDTSVCSSLIYACCVQGQQQLARKVYDMCAAKGVYPSVSIYNRLMDLYASERRLGDVVSLLTDMTQAAKISPNLNTYRILLNACQQTDQAALAFEVFAVMKANRMTISTERYAVTMYHTLLKCCLNMLRHIWAQHQPNPAPWASRSRASRPVVRLAEARQVLLALGSNLEARGPSSLLFQDPSASMWTQYALSTYRDMLARGWRPNTDVLDKLMACLRVPGSMALQHAIATGRLIHSARTAPVAGPNGSVRPGGVQGVQGSPGSGGHVQGSPGSAPFSWATQFAASSSGRVGGSGMEADQRAGAAQADAQAAQAAKYQLVFERRAVGLVEDAIARGLLPSFSVDQPCNLDLRDMPPNLAEVYMAALLLSIDRRAQRARDNSGAEGGAAGDAQLFFHKVTILVPPFDAQYVLWPSYVPKLTALHQTHADEAQQESMSPQAPPLTQEDPAQPANTAASSQQQAVNAVAAAQQQAASAVAGDQQQPASANADAQQPAESTAAGSQQLAGSTAAEHQQPQVSTAGNQQPEASPATDGQQPLHASTATDSQPSSNGSVPASQHLLDSLHHQKEHAAARQEHTSGTDGPSSHLQAQQPVEFNGTAARGLGGRAEAASGPQGPGSDLNTQPVPSSTGLAVAATLRRFKFFSRMDAARGLITLDSQDITSWVREKRTWELRRSGALNTAGAPQGAAMSQQWAQHTNDSDVPPTTSTHEWGPSTSSSPSAMPLGRRQRMGQPIEPMISPGLRPQQRPGLGPSLNPALQQRNIRLGMGPGGLGPGELGNGLQQQPGLLSTGLQNSVELAPPPISQLSPPAPALNSAP